MFLKNKNKFLIISLIIQLVPLQNRASVCGCKKGCDAWVDRILSTREKRWYNPLTWDRYHPKDFCPQACAEFNDEWNGQWIDISKQSLERYRKTEKAKNLCNRTDIPSLPVNYCYDYDALNDIVKEQNSNNPDWQRIKQIYDKFCGVSVSDKRCANKCYKKLEDNSVKPAGMFSGECNTCPAIWLKKWPL